MKLNELNYKAQPWFQHFQQFWGTSSQIHFTRAAIERDHSHKTRSSNFNFIVPRVKGSYDDHNPAVILQAGLSLSWSVLVGPDQHSRKPTSTEGGKNEIRPAKKKN